MISFEVTYKTVVPFSSPEPLSEIGNNNVAGVTTKGIGANQRHLICVLNYSKKIFKKSGELFVECKRTTTDGKDSFSSRLNESNNRVTEMRCVNVCEKLGHEHD